MVVPTQRRRENPIRPESLPQLIQLGRSRVVLRLLEPADRDGLLRFGRSQSVDDLMFLRRDITNPEEIDVWIEETVSGRLTTVIAGCGEDVLGYVTLDKSPLRWMRHVAEIRILVGREARSSGLGSRLLDLAFDAAVTAGMRKLTARMPLEQTGARRAFERLGFEQEATLPGHVLDSAGERHDLVVMGFDIEHRLRPQCELCGGRVLHTLSYAGRTLCQDCFEMETAEVGTGD